MFPSESPFQRAEAVRQANPELQLQRQRASFPKPHFDDVTVPPARRFMRLRQVAHVSPALANDRGALA